jgi:phosphopantothenoylcysteine decarboxylase/phosphopantothenate--cysteine ligase
VVRYISRRRCRIFAAIQDFTAMRGKSILLIIGGGIAAYKSLELIRRLAERGVKTRPILTRAGAEFVTPLSVSALAADKVYTDLFSLTDESEMGHIELSRAADLVVVAPATADLMGKLAAGLASDLASTTLLATDKRILMAPAMNVRMWESPSVRRSTETLVRDGVLFVGPNDGEMACGEFGPGRMAEPLEIVAAIEKALQEPGGVLKGLKALVTAGPTHEPLDPVRFLANRSSGKQGYAIAGALAGAGAQTVLVSGPVEIAPPWNVKLVKVTTAREMLAACEAELPSDIAVMSAAVADWRPDIAANGKIKKNGEHEAPAIRLVENPDILATLGQHKNRPRLVVGFAAETDNLLANAQSKRTRKHADWIIANDVSANVLGESVMGSDRNQVHLITATGQEDWPEMSKRDVARRLVQRIAQQFQENTP